MLIYVNQYIGLILLLQHQKLDDWKRFFYLCLHCIPIMFIFVDEQSRCITQMRSEIVMTKRARKTVDDVNVDTVASEVDNVVNTEVVDAVNETASEVVATDVATETYVHGARWQATKAKQIASFAAGKEFRAGSNRAIAYELLCRNGGTTIAEYRANIRNQQRNDASLAIELKEVADFSQRQLFRTVVNGVKYYTLDAALNVASNEHAA
jgi:hypothetical protein